MHLVVIALCGSSLGIRHPMSVGRVMRLRRLHMERQYGRERCRVAEDRILADMERVNSMGRGELWGLIGFMGFLIGCCIVLV